MTVDISETLAPNSDQLDAIDLVAGARVFTITKVSAGNAEQPVNIHLAEFPRVWRPSKSMRRVLAACWGTDASVWAGRRVKLYCDPDVMFGKDKVGGTRIEALSHIDKPKSIPLLVSRGKSATFRVQPLPDAAPTSPTVSPETLAELIATFERKGIAEDKRLAGVNHYTQGKATALEVITQQQAEHMLTVLAEKPDVAATETPATEHDPTLDESWGKSDALTEGGGE